MKKMFLYGGIAMMLVMVMGCATTGPAVSDEELVQQRVELWGQGLVEQDIDKVMAAISESFATPQAPDKAALADFLGQAIEAGYLEEAEVSFTDAQYAIDNGICTVYPVDLMSIAGSVAVELVLTKEDGAWMITGMEIDGM